MKTIMALVSAALLLGACGGGEGKTNLSIGESAKFDSGYTATITEVSPMQGSKAFPDIKNVYRIRVQLCAPDKEPDGFAPTTIAVLDTKGESYYAQWATEYFLPDEDPSTYLTPNKRIELMPGVCQDYSAVWGVEYDAKPRRVKLGDEPFFGGKFKYFWDVQ